MTATQPGTIAQLCILTLVLTSHPAAQAAPQKTRESATLVVKGAILIDVVTGKAVPDSVIVISGNRVSRVISSDSEFDARDGSVIDAKGKFAVPGLVDIHTHTHSWTPPLFLYHGVTSVLDTGNMSDWIFAQADAIAKGKLPGPRIYAVGEGLGPTGESIGKLYRKFEMETPAQIADVARRMIDMGAVALKVFHLTPPEMIEAAARVAQERGVPLTGHIGAADAREAALAGIRGLHHATGIAMATIKNPEKRRQLKEKYPHLGYAPIEYYMELENSEEILRLLLDKEVALIPTLNHFIGKKLSPRREAYQQEDLAFLEKLDGRYFPKGAVEITYTPQPYVFQTLPADDVADYIQKMEVGWNKLCAFIGRFHRAGGTVLAGSDDGTIGIPGKGLHREMEILASCGLSPLEALQSATIKAAQFIKQQEIGSIREGAYADLVLLDGDPLQDIRNSQKIFMVIKDGKPVERKIDERFRNPLPMPMAAGPRPIPAADFLPQLTMVTPSTAVEGDAELHILIEGSNFFEDSVARFDIFDLKTRYLSPTRLEAVLPSSLLRKAGTYPITVVNPGSGGGASALSYFLVKFH
ncbi:MAG: amidohydrolase family protein [Acidobacteria bacterium]|nr:amidohydrolase family protein [Acidobacteriota bacterium]